MSSGMRQPETGLASREIQDAAEISRQHTRIPMKGRPDAGNDAQLCMSQQF